MIDTGQRGHKKVEKQQQHIQRHKKIQAKREETTEASRMQESWLNKLESTFIAPAFPGTLD